MAVADWVQRISELRPERLAQAVGWWCPFCGLQVDADGLPEEAHAPLCLWRAAHEQVRESEGAK